MKVLGAGFSIMTRALTRVIGPQLLTDVSQFVAALETMFGGFRQRAEETYRLLAAPGTAFFVVAAPEPDALREASYFVDRLGTEEMPLAGLVLNRVHRSRAAALSAPRSLSGAEVLAEHGETLPPGCGRTAAARRPGAAVGRESPAARAVHQAHPRPGCGSAGTGRGRPRPRRTPRGGRRAGGLGSVSQRLSPADRSITRRVPAAAVLRARTRSRAHSSRVRQLVTSGRRRSRARRSRSVIPPQTPNSTRLSSASARHSVRTPPRHTALARFCAAPARRARPGRFPCMRRVWSSQ